MRGVHWEHSLRISPVLFQETTRGRNEGRGLGLDHCFLLAKREQKVDRNSTFCSELEGGSDRLGVKGIPSPYGTASPTSCRSMGGDFQGAARLIYSLPLSSVKECENT